jgi:6-phosphogluconolactonase
MSIEIEVTSDPARACSAMLVGAAAGGTHIALTGGSTPRAAYREFVDAVQAVDLDLSRVQFWFGDERCVPPDDERSNYRMVSEALLGPLGDRPVAGVHRIQGELGLPAAADEYERELREAREPRFDLLMLGMGPDGHVASLFPDQPTLSERSRLVVGVPEAGLEPFVPRVSLTFSALARARQVLFLITGESKADAVAAVFGPDAKPDRHHPASMLIPLAKEITVLLDPAAASRLPDEGS